MAASFASASSQDLRNASAPFTGMPFTVGMWIFPPASGTAREFFSLADIASANNYWSLRFNASNQVGISAAAGGTTVTGTITSTALTANAWAFIIGRFINAINRRVACLFSDGSTGHAQNTTARAPTGVNTVALGGLITSSPANYYSGFIGEFWYTNSDIQADGAQLQDSLLRQLAYGGPFSVPHIAKSIVEYRSLFSTLDSTNELGDEIYYGKSGRQTWVNTNGVTLGPHPNLPHTYRYPGDAAGIVMF